MGLLAYPTAASWIAQYNQSKVTADYSAQVDDARPDAKTQIAQAHAYNEALSSGAVLEANNQRPHRCRLELGQLLELHLDPQGE